MSNLLREVLNSEDAANALGYLSDIYIKPRHQEVQFYKKYSYILAKGNGSSYTYPRALYTYSFMTNNEVQEYPILVYSTGGEQSLQLVYDPDNIYSINGFYYIIDIAKYDEETIKELIQLAEEKGIDINDQTTWEGYKENTINQSLNPKILQVYPPIIYTPIGNMQRLTNNGNYIDHSMALKIENDFAYLLPYSNSNETTAYLFKGMFTITYSTSSDMSNKQTTYIPSFNPATESNSNQYAYMSSTDIIIKDSALPNLPEDNINIYYSWPSNIVSYFRITFNDNYKNDIKTKYATTYFPLSYTINSLDTTNTHILRRQCSLGQNISFTTTYTQGQSGLSYYQFYKCSNNQLLTSSSYITFMPNANSGDTDPLAFKYSTTYYGNNNPATSSLYNSLEFKGTIMNIFLIKTDGVLTNTQIQTFSKVIKKSNSNQESSCMCDIDFIDDNGQFHIKRDYGLVLYTGYENNQLIGQKTKIRTVTTTQYYGETENFEIYSIPSSYTSGEAKNIPAFKLWNKKNYSSYIQCISYNILYNNGNGQNMFTFINPCIEPSNNLHEVTYYTNTNLSYETKNANNDLTTSGTYYFVAASIVVPCKDTNGNVYVKKGILFSPEQIYSLRKSQTSSGFWTTRRTNDKIIANKI